ncbi:uncharacterized protein [Nicotiana tomentosiformis]|uniref:uncharacterized protein n=1 Tax=Nicotiana tomentosiformis TaxID=4098 RepID=UPI00388C3B57
MLEDEQHRLERYGRLQPPSFCGLEGEDAQGFLDRCQRILRMAAILETGGVSFTTFQISGAAFSWWEAYERRKPVSAAPLTWQQFSVLCLEKFMSQSRREELHKQFEQLRHDDMSMMKYEMKFSELVCHAIWLVPTDRERIRRFIDGLTFQLRLLMTRERVSGFTFDDLVIIAHQIDMVRSQERVERGGQESS